MSAERLSRLQGAILEVLYSQQVAGHNLPHAGLILFVGEKVGKVQPDPFFGRSFDESFRSALSHSLRNLEDKGMVELYGSHIRGYKGKVSGAKLTDKGEAALNATLKLRIREEDQAMKARVERNLGGGDHG